MTNPRKIYFISDVHLGLYPAEQSARREKLLVDWLNMIKEDASELYLVGDIFDFWHEYRHVIPKRSYKVSWEACRIVGYGHKASLFYRKP